MCNQLDFNRAWESGRVAGFYFGNLVLTTDGGSLVSTTGAILLALSRIAE
jgi:hypothetical protein